MKKQILIAIVALIGSGTCLILNAQDFECGSTGLRQKFDGAGRTSGQKEDRPSVKPDRGASDQPRFAGSGGGTHAGTSTPSSTPSRTKTKSAPEERKKDAVALMVVGGILAFGGLFAAFLLSQPVLLSPLCFLGIFVMACGDQVYQKASEEIRANKLRSEEK